MPPTRVRASPAPPPPALASPPPRAPRVAPGTASRGVARGAASSSGRRARATPPGASSRAPGAPPNDDAGATTITPAALAAARAATVVVAPHVRAARANNNPVSRLLAPFTASSRRGSGVCVSLDDGKTVAVVTAAHVACLAGAKNRLEVRFESATGENKRTSLTTRLARVAAVHPDLDLAALAFVDDEPLLERDDPPFHQRRDGNQTMPEKPVAPPPTPPWMPLSSDTPAVGDAVVALGYPMLWSAALSEVLETARNRTRAVRQPPRDARARVGDERVAGPGGAFRGKKLTALDTSGVTHCLHSACVASGASGGPLANARGEAVGVHSFGDAFYGATRDVAVLCDAATCADGLGFDAHRRGAGGGGLRGGVRDETRQRKHRANVGPGAEADVPGAERGAEKGLDPLASRGGHTGSEIISKRTRFRSLSRARRRGRRPRRPSPTTTPLPRPDRSPPLPSRSLPHPAPRVPRPGPVVVHPRVQSPCAGAIGNAAPDPWRAESPRRPPYRSRPAAATSVAVMTAPGGTGTRARGTSEPPPRNHHRRSL